MIKNKNFLTKVNYIIDNKPWARSYLNIQKPMD